MKSNIGRTAVSFWISFILHFAVALVVGMSIVYTESETVQKWVETTFLEPKKPPKPKARETAVKKPVIKPTVPTETMAVQQFQVTPRVTTAAIIRTTTVTPQTAIEFSNKVVKVEAPVNPNVPRVISPNQPMPQVMTTADIPISDAPGALAFSAPIASTAKISGPSVARRETVTGIQVKEEKMLGLSMIETTSAANLEDALKDLVEKISLEKQSVVPPLPKGEPGGRVIGRGKEIIGVFRFVRLKHHFSDWWDDPTSIAGIANWLNEHTQIRTDLNVEGGPVTLIDANLMKSPLVVMTGHDPALIRQRGTGGKMPMPEFRRKLTTSEKIALRKYLIDKGGMLFSDDCGHNSVNYPFTRIVVSALVSALPEYPVTSIPNDHEIYNCYYNLGGPPQGANMFWNHGPKGVTPKQLKGIFIDGRIAVLLSQRDYLCAAETINVHSGKICRQATVYRFLTNVVVYALTHGGISDYSNYVPAEQDTVELPTKPPAAVPGATPRSK